MANYMDNWTMAMIRAEIRKLAREEFREEYYEIREASREEFRKLFREEYYELIREQNKRAYEKDLTMTALFGEGLGPDKPRSEVTNPTQTWTVEKEDLIDLIVTLSLRPWQQDRLYFWVDHLEQSQEARRSEDV